MPDPGYNFRDGILFLKAPIGGEVRLSWSPVPEAHMLLANGAWHQFLPDFRILAPNFSIPPDADESVKARLQAKQVAFQGFRAILPASLVTAVEPFTSYQWPLMTLLKHSTAASDLAKANPVLAYAVANNGQLQSEGGHEIAATRATRYCRLKQREILDELGFPNTEAMARLFKKIPIPIVYPGLIRKLRQSVAFPEIAKMLGHLPSLNTGSLFVACQADMAALVTPKLLQEIAGHPDEEMSAPTADLLAEIVSFAAEMHKKTLLRPFASLRKVQECHDQLTREHQTFEGIVTRQKEIETTQRRLMANHSYKGQLPAYLTDHAARLQAEYKRLEALRPDRLARPAPPPRLPAQPAVIDRPRLRALQLPPPPIPGTNSIVPLTSFAEFEEEAASQSICLDLNLSYLDRVMRGEIYIYRVIAPVRHTLSIVKRGNNCWQIAELRQAKNLARTEDAEVAVVSWLNANQTSL